MDNKLIIAGGVFIALTIGYFIINAGNKPALNEVHSDRHLEDNIASTNMQKSQTSPIDEDKVKQIVQDYIDQNPSIIVESENKFREVKQKEAKERVTKKIIANKDRLFAKSLDPIYGSSAKDAVVLVEFFDYNCGFCRKMQPVVAEIVKNNPDVRVVFKELTAFGEQSAFASKASLAVNKIDPTLYYRFHTELMQRKTQNIEEAVSNAAKTLGIDYQRLQAEMESQDVRQLIQDNIVLANDLEVEAVPALIIGDELILGYPNPVMIQQKIDSIRSANRGANFVSDNVASQSSDKQITGQNDEAVMKQQSVDKPMENVPSYTPDDLSSSGEKAAA